MKHVRQQYNRWSFRLSILGKYVDAGESFETEEAAGCAADLAKFHLRNTFKLDLEDSLGSDGEQFSALAFRRGVDLSDSYRVEKALSPGVKAFIAKHRAELEAHRDAAPPETVFSKIRNHPPSMENKAVRDWVIAGELAGMDERAFKAVDHDSFFLRLRVVQNSFETAIKSLKLALRMHGGVTNEKLLRRRTDIESLLAHFEADRKYVEEFSSGLKSECEAVSTAVKILENSRPALT